MILRYSSAAVALLLAISVGAASAAQVVEPQTGLSVAPPAGYVAAQEPPRGRAAGALKVTSQTDPDAGCIIGFEDRPRQDVSFEDLNRANSRPESVTRARQVLALVQNVKSFESVTIGGVAGFLAVVEPKPEFANPALPAQRSLMAMLETPKGRTVAACTAKTSTFPSRQKEFEAVVRSVIAPR